MGGEEYICYNYNLKCITQDYKIKYFQMILAFILFHKVHLARSMKNAPVIK